MRTIGQKPKNRHTCFPKDFSKNLISFSALHFLSPADSVLNDFVMMHCVFMPNTQLCPALVAQYPFTAKSLCSLQDTLYVHGRYLTPASEGKSWPRQSCAFPSRDPSSPWHGVAESCWRISPLLLVQNENKVTSGR